MCRFFCVIPVRVFLHLVILGRVFLHLVILGLDPRIQVMEAVATRHISHSLDRHGRAAPSR